MWVISAPLILWPLQKCGIKVAHHYLKGTENIFLKRTVLDHFGSSCALQFFVKRWNWLNAQRNTMGFTFIICVYFHFPRIASAKSSPWHGPLWAVLTMHEAHFVWDAHHFLPSHFPLFCLKTCQYLRISRRFRRWYIDIPKVAKTTLEYTLCSADE